jgi:hypothetical protein
MVDGGEGRHVSASANTSTTTVRPAGNATPDITTRLVQARSAVDAGQWLWGWRTQMLLGATIAHSHYATTIDGKMSSVVMASSGIDSSDSKEVSQFEQYHWWRMCVPWRYSDFSGAISSSLHRTHFIPKVERRLDTIVAMVASSMPIPDRSNLSTIQIGSESFSLMQENFYAALHQRRGVPAWTMRQRTAIRKGSDLPLGGSR